MAWRGEAWRGAARRGRRGGTGIGEVRRWQTDLADTERTFKLNDHYTPGMARLWMNTHGHQFPKFFELRS